MADKGMCLAGANKLLVSCYSEICCVVRTEPTSLLDVEAEQSSCTSLAHHLITSLILTHSVDRVGPSASCSLAIHSRHSTQQQAAYLAST